MPIQIQQLHQAIALGAQQLYHFAEQQPQQAANTRWSLRKSILKALMMRCCNDCARHGAFSHVLPLLPLQKGLLFHAQTSGAQGSYNSLTRLTLSGDVSVASVQQALNQVLQRHPQLAAQFDSELSLQPLQLLPEGDLHWPLQILEVEDIEAAEHQALSQDLFRQPVMLQATLIRIAMKHAGRCCLMRIIWWWMAGQRR
ncbi:condensation domain-containing protein (plasmid) [Pseudomonas silvicola]|nr:condensation domain-containing protein [Pseudomonas silvicola]